MTSFTKATELKMTHFYNNTVSQITLHFQVLHKKRGKRSFKIVTSFQQVFQLVKAFLSPAKNLLALVRGIFSNSYLYFLGLHAFKSSFQIYAEFFSDLNSSGLCEPDFLNAYILPV